MAITVAQLKTTMDVSDVEKAEGALGHFNSALGRVATTAAGFVIGKAITDAPRFFFNAAQAAADDAASVGRLQQAVENSGVSWDAYSGKINDAISHGQALAFSDDDTRNALSLLTQETGSTEDALTRLSAAQDLARGTGMDLSTASKLLGKLTDDNVNVLKRYGISVEKGATAQDLLNRVDQRFGGQAAKFAESGAGQWMHLKDQLQEAQEQIGYFLLPRFTQLAGLLTGTVMPAVTRLIDLLGSGDWSGAADMIGGALSSAFDHVTDAASTVEGKFISLVSGIDWGRVATTAWTLFTAALGSVGGLAVDLASSFIALVTGVDWGSVASTAWSLLGTALSAGVNLAIDLGGAFLSLVTGIDWSGVASAVWSGLGAALSAGVSLAVDLGGAFINLVTGVDWASVAGSVWGFLGDAMLTAWSGIVDAGQWFGGIVGAVDWATLAGTVWGFLGDQLAVAWSGIVDGTQWFGGVISGVDWTAVATMVWGLFNTALTSSADALRGLQDALNNLDLNVASGSAQTFIDLLQNQLVAAVGNAEQSLRDLNQLVADIGQVFGDNNLTVLKFAEIIGGSALLGYIETMRGAFVLVDGAVRGADAALRGLNDILPTVTATLGSAAGGAKQIYDAFATLPGLVSSAAEALYHGVVDWVQRMGTDSLSAVQGLSTSAAGAIQGMASTIEGEVGSLVGSVQGFISDMVSTVSGLFTTLAGNAGNAAVDLYNRFTTEISSMASSVEGAVSSMVDTVVGYIAGLPGAAVSAVGDLSGALYQAGVDLVQGFANGILSQVQSIADAASSIAHAAEDAITGALGIHSPSTVMAAHGADIGAGLAGGMTGSLPLVESAAQQLSQAIIAQVESQVQAQVVPQAQLSGTDIVNALISGIQSGHNETQNVLENWNGDVAAAIAQMQADLTGKLHLAQIAGDDTSDLKAKLDAISKIIATWSADTGETLQDAITTAASSSALQATLVSTWQSALDNLGNVISGKAATDLQDKILQLNNELAVAVAAGAPQAVIDGLNATLAQTQAQLQVVGAEYAAAVQQGLAGGITPQDVSDAISKATGIDDGSLLSSLQGKLDQLNQAIATGTALGWSTDMLAAMQDQANTLQAQLTDVMAQTSTAAAAGLLDPKALAAWQKATGVITQIPIDQINALLPKMKDFGVGLIGQLVDGVNSGSVSMQAALDTLNGMVSASMSDLDKTNDLAVTDIIAKLQDLEQQYTGQLAQAIISGNTDLESSLNAAIGSIDQMLQALSAQAKQTADDIRAIADAALQAENAANGIKTAFGGGGGGPSSGGLGGFGTTDQLPTGQFTGGAKPPTYLSQYPNVNSYSNGGGQTPIVINNHFYVDGTEVYNALSDNTVNNAHLTPVHVGGGLAAV